MNVTQKQEAQAKKIMDELDINEVYINDRGEFFSTLNLASLSVKGDKKSYLKIERKPEKADVKEDAYTDESAKAKILSIDKIDSLDYQKDMKPIVEVLKLATADNKKATLVAALEAYKLNLKGE